mmetsp:Transcript_20821/g.51113  ORF Transcript_20821/g.51113 Transcript_20821/m.51113 type:complete len:102 (-) Transcript_20821:524-829(-)
MRICLFFFFLYLAINAKKNASVFFVSLNSFGDNSWNVASVSSIPSFNALPRTNNGIFISLAIGCNYIVRAIAINRQKKSPLGQNMITGSVRASASQSNPRF